MKLRNLKFINTESTLIDCEYEHPVFGWIPYTASPNDVEPLGVEIFEAALSLNPLPYVAPTPPTATEILQSKRDNAVLTRREFFLAIDAAGMYDAVLALKDNPLTPRATTIELDTATEFKRTWPTLVEAAIQLGVTDAQLDAVFGIA